MKAENLEKLVNLVKLVSPVKEAAIVMVVIVIKTDINPDFKLKGKAKDGAAAKI